MRRSNGLIGPYQQGRGEVRLIFLACGHKRLPCNRIEEVRAETAREGRPYDAGVILRRALFLGETSAGSPACVLCCG